MLSEIDSKLVPVIVLGVDLEVLSKALSLVVQLHKALLEMVDQVVLVPRPSVPGSHVRVVLSNRHVPGRRLLHIVDSGFQGHSLCELRLLWLGGVRNQFIDVSKVSVQSVSVLIGGELESVYEVFKISSVVSFFIKIQNFIFLVSQLFLSKRRGSFLGSSLAKLWLPSFSGLVDLEPVVFTSAVFKLRANSHSIVEEFLIIVNRYIGVVGLEVFFVTL